MIRTHVGIPVAHLALREESAAQARETGQEIDQEIATAKAVFVHGPDLTSRMTTFIGVVTGVGVLVPVLGIAMMKIGSTVIVPVPAGESRTTNDHAEVHLHLLVGHMLMTTGSPPPTLQMTEPPV